MNLKVPKKTNSFLVWSFNDILTVLLPLWLLCLISEFRYAPIDSFLQPRFIFPEIIGSGPEVFSFQQYSIKAASMSQLLLR